MTANRPSSGAATGTAVKLSFIVGTRNRASALKACLDSIAAAVAAAAPIRAEIAVADNGSTDDTEAVVRAWMASAPLPVILLSEPRPGRARALNQAIRATSGALIACTDDDCVLDPGYVRDLLRHDAADTGPVLRGGRVALGDPTDMPYTIVDFKTRMRFSRATNDARRVNPLGMVVGCNMTFRRALFDRIGPFDEAFGPGSRIGSGDDAEFMFRAYVAGVVIEAVTDMLVYHHHGRKTAAAIYALFRRYLIGSGALHAKYLLRHPDLCRPYLWDMRRAAREARAGINTYMPDAGFSYSDKVKYETLGALRYVFGRRRPWAAPDADAQRRTVPPASPPGPGAGAALRRAAGVSSFDRPAPTP